MEKKITGPMEVMVLLTVNDRPRTFHITVDAGIAASGGDPIGQMLNEVRLYIDLWLDKEG